jgi:uncharacterized protein (UPF0276 family)
MGFRTELATDLMAAPSTVDFVEVVAETCFTQKGTRREAAALAEIWPVIPHGVKLSLGTAEGVDDSRVHRLAALARELRAPLVSEHVSFTRAGGSDIGHLTQLPRTRDAVAVFARNVDRARRLLPDVPLLLENVAWSFLWPDDEMDEAAFYQEVVRATGCELLLDLGNLYANALNEGRDPVQALLGYPLDRVGMVHVAGGVLEDGFYFDTHAHAVPQDVMALVGEVLARRPDVPVMIERDANIVFGELAAELATIRALPRGGGEGLRRAIPREPVPLPQGDIVRLACEQAAVAGELAGRGPITSAVAQRIGTGAIERSRGILERKRIDDALPLLMNLGRSPCEVRRVAEQTLAAIARAPHAVAPTDAWHIAEAALGEPELAASARLDLLLLRARFAGPARDGSLRPRKAPFVGFTRLDDGRRVRATKGFGPLASVTLRTER